MKKLYIYIGNNYRVNKVFLTNFVNDTHFGYPELLEGKAICGCLASSLFLTEFIRDRICLHAGNQHTWAFGASQIFGLGMLNL